MNFDNFDQIKICYILELIEEEEEKKKTTGTIPVSYKHMKLPTKQ